MRRALPAVIALSTALGGIAVGSPPANAYPVIPPPPCSFTLSGPDRAGDAVTATVQSAQCGVLATPYTAVACLQAGPGAPTQCVQAHGTDPATVSLPYQAGVSFIASGRGCSRFVNMEPGPECQNFDPTPAVL